MNWGGGGGVINNNKSSNRTNVTYEYILEEIKHKGMVDSLMSDIELNNQNIQISQNEQLYTNNDNRNSTELNTVVKMFKGLI
jgi:hypothetical protein